MNLYHYLIHFWETENGWTVKRIIQILKVNIFGSFIFFFKHIHIVLNITDTDVFYHRMNIFFMMKYRTIQRHSALYAPCTTNNTITLINCSNMLYGAFVIIQLTNIINLKQELGHTVHNIYWEEIIGDTSVYCVINIKKNQSSVLDLETGRYDMF